MFLKTNQLRRPLLRIIALSVALCAGSVWAQVPSANAGSAETMGPGASGGQAPLPRTAREGDANPGSTPTGTPAPATPLSLQAGIPAVQELFAGRVLVMSFLPIDQPASQPWVGSSLQQTLLADLSRGKWDAIAQAAADINPEDRSLSFAVSQGQKYSAETVLFGTYVLNQGKIRFTGQVVDVRSGKAIGGLVASGLTQNLFALQDELASQAGEILTAHRDAMAAANQPAQSPALQLPTSQAPAGTSTLQSPTDGRDVTGPDTIYADRQPTNRTTLNILPEKAAVPYAGSDLQQAVSTRGQSLNRLVPNDSMRGVSRLYQYSTFQYPAYQWSGYYGYPQIYGRCDSPLIRGQYEYINNNRWDWGYVSSSGYYYRGGYTR